MMGMPEGSHKPTYQHDCLGSCKIMSVVVHKHRMEQHPHISIIIQHTLISMSAKYCEAPRTPVQRVDDYKRHPPSYDAEVQLY